MANTHSKATDLICKISLAERYTMAQDNGIHLDGDWLKEAGFTANIPIKIRVMPDCLVITAINQQELTTLLTILDVAPELIIDNNRGA